MNECCKEVVEENWQWAYSDNRAQADAVSPVVLRKVLLPS